MSYKIEKAKFHKAGVIDNINMNPSDSKELLDESFLFFVNYEHEKSKFYKGRSSNNTTGSNIRFIFPGDLRVAGRFYIFGGLN